MINIYRSKLITHRLLSAFILGVLFFMILGLFVQLDAGAPNIPSQDMATIDFDWDTYTPPTPLASDNYMSYTELISNYCSVVGEEIVCSDALNELPNKVIRIDSALELYNFSINVSYHSNFTYSSKYLLLGLHYVLGGDIDYSVMGANAFIPIGYDFLIGSTPYYASFYGTFNGQGFVIENLYVTGDIDYLTVTDNEINIPVSKYYSMFAYNNGTIKNLGLINPTFELLEYIPGLYYVSNLVGLNNQTVDHVYVIDERGVDDAGIRYIAGTSNDTPFTAAGIVHTNGVDGIFHDAYYASPVVVYSSYINRFKNYIEPVLAIENNTTNISYNLFYDTTVGGENGLYLLVVPVGAVNVIIKTPSTLHTPISTENLKLGDFGSSEDPHLDSKWFFYGGETYPLLLGLNYNETLNVYEIYTAIELAFLARLFDFSSVQYNTKDYRVMADIDMGVLASGTYQTPEQTFSGTFSGLYYEGEVPKSHIISNLSINTGALIGQSYYIGLFSIVTETVDENIDYKNIHNIIFDDMSITLTNSNAYYSSNLYVGSIAGNLSNGYIKDVLVDGTIDLGTQAISNTHIGGIVGLASGVISRVSMRGTITGGSHTYTEAMVFTPNFYMGGIVGAATGNHLSISNSINHANIIGISATGHKSTIPTFQVKIGGIIGYLVNTSVINHNLFDSTNTGKITAGVIYSTTPTAYIHMGGIFGELSGNAPILANSTGRLFANLYNLSTEPMTAAYTNTNTIRAAGIGVSNTNQNVEYAMLYNSTSFNFNLDSITYNASPKMRFVATIYHISAYNITLSRVYNDADFFFGNSYYNRISPFFYTEQTNIDINLNFVENKGNITLDIFTLGAETWVAGITTNSKVNFLNVINSGDIIVKGINTNTSYSLFVAGISRSLSVGYKIVNSMNLGDINFGNISGGSTTDAISTSNIYVGGLVNINVSGNLDEEDPIPKATVGIINSINYGDISSTIDSTYWAVDGNNNTFVGGIATMNAGTIQDSGNMGNITVTNSIRNNSGGVSTQPIFVAAPTTDNTYAGLITRYKAGVVIGGIVGVTLNGNARIFDTSNNGNVIAQAARYARAGGILGICLQQEATAGGVIANVDGSSYLQPPNTLMTNLIHIKHSILSNGLNFGNVSSITEIITNYSTTSSTSSVIIYRSYYNVSGTMIDDAITGSYSTSSYLGSSQRIDIRASAGGVIGYGLSVMTKMLNHGTVTSTDVAGGIVGATYVLGNDGTLTDDDYLETIVEIDTAINYGNIEPVSTTKYTNMLSYNLDDELVVANNMTNDKNINNEPDLTTDRSTTIWPPKRTGDTYTIRELPESRRGFGGIFGRLQRGGDGLMKTGVFNNIINANKNIDLIGRVDQAHNYTFSMGMFQFPGAVYYSATNINGTYDRTQGVFTGFTATADYVVSLVQTGTYTWNVTLENRTIYHQGVTTTILQNNGQRVEQKTTASRNTPPTGYTVNEYTTFSTVYHGVASVPRISETEEAGAQYIYGEAFIAGLESQGLTDYIYHVQNKLLATRFREQTIEGVTNPQYRANGMYVLASSAGKEIGAVLPSNIDILKLYGIDESSELSLYNTNYDNIISAYRQEEWIKDEEPLDVVDRYEAMWQTRFNENSEFIEGDFVLSLDETKYNDLDPSSTNQTFLNNGVLVPDGTNPNLGIITYSISLEAFSKMNAKYLISDMLIPPNSVIARSKGTSESIITLQSDLANDTYVNNISTTNTPSLIVTIPSSPQTVTLGTFSVYSEAFIGDSFFATETTTLDPEDYYHDYQININFTAGITNYNGTKINTVEFNGNPANIYTNDTVYDANTTIIDFRPKLQSPYYTTVNVFGSTSSVEFNFIDTNDILSEGYDFSNLFKLYYDPISGSDQLISNSHYQVSSTPVDSNGNYSIIFTFDMIQLRGGDYYFEYSYYPTSKVYKVYFTKIKSSTALITDFSYYTENNSFLEGDFPSYIDFDTPFNPSTILSSVINQSDTAYYYASNTYSIIHQYTPTKSYTGSIRLSPFSTLTSVSSSYTYSSGIRTYTITYTMTSEDGTSYTNLTRTVVERTIDLTKVYKNNNLVSNELVTVEREADQTSFMLDLGLNPALGLYEHDSLVYPHIELRINGSAIQPNSGFSVSSTSTNIFLTVLPQVLPATYNLSFIYHRDASTTYSLSSTLLITMSPGANAYLEDIRFSLLATETIYPDMMVSDQYGVIKEPIIYNPLVYYAGIDYNGSKENNEEYFIINGYVANIPLESYSPYLVQYLPIGATVAREYYHDTYGMIYTPEINEENFDILVTDLVTNETKYGKDWLIANFNVDPATGQEPSENELVQIKYRTTSEDENQQIYYYVSVIDMIFNVSLIFNINYCTDSSLTDCSLAKLSESNEFLNRTIIIKTTSYKVEKDGVPIIIDENPIYNPTTYIQLYDAKGTLQNEIYQFVYTANASYSYTFGRNRFGFFAFDVVLPIDTYGNELYDYKIKYQALDLNTYELPNFGYGVDGKVFYINSSVRNRTRTFEIYVYPNTPQPTEKPWGLFDIIRTWFDN